MGKVDDATLRSALAKYYTAKVTLDEVQDEFDNRKKELLSMMKSAGVTSIEADVREDHVRGSLVEATRIVINEDQLRDVLGTRWDKVTKQVLDKNLLDAHVQTGAITVEEVAGVSTEVPNAPYVKITTKKAKNPVTKRRQPSTAAPKVRKSAAAPRVAR